MSGVEIRQVQADEVGEVIYWLTGYSLNPSPPLPDKEERQDILRHRRGVTYLALFEDNEPAACVASTQMTQHVRAKQYGMGGVWAVATHPAARRKGYSKRLLAELMATMQREGQPLSGLYPFRESFYERLGYTTFPLGRKAIFNSITLAPLLDWDLEGEVEMASFGQGYKAYRDYSRKLLECTHGMAVIELEDEPDRLSDNYWLALARVGGETVGLMQYQLQGEQVTRYKLRAIRFYYHDVRGRYLLLNWIARHIDQAETVELWLPAFERPETWLADMAVRVESLTRAPMGRVVDVAGIGGMQVGEGSFAFKLSDPQCPWNEGVWRFESIDGDLKVSAANNAECAMSIQGLSALVYGTHDPGDFRWRGWGDPTKEVQATMRTMFPPRSPYIHEFF
jgi:predicted acetyltransferase